MAASCSNDKTEILDETGEPVALAGIARKAAFSSTLLALCLAFVFVRLPFIFTVPMSEAPDEYAHFWVARFLRDHFRLPSSHEVMQGAASAVYGSLPQFGYLPHIAVGMLMPPLDFVLFARFGSLLMGLVLLYCAYAFGRELFPRQRLLALALPVAIIFHPQMAFVHAYLNNDATASALSAAILLLAVRSLRRGLVLWRSLCIGVLVGWLVLTKYSGVAILPAVALYLMAAAFLRRSGFRQALVNFVACAAVAAGVCGWWFFRNAGEFSGDILGTQTMYRIWASTFNRPQTYHLPASHIIKDIRWWRMMFFSFWGMFGYMNKYMWRPVYLLYLAYLCTAVGGFFIAGGQLLKAKVQSGWTRLSLVQRTDIVIWSALVLAVFINLSSMIWASTTNLGGPQGRYLFPCEVPVMALLIAGLNACSVRYGKQLVLSFLIFNALVCMGAWYWLFQLYGFHGHPV